MFANRLRHRPRQNLVFSVDNGTSIQARYVEYRSATVGNSKAGTERPHRTCQIAPAVLTG